MLIEYDTYNLAGHWLPALINGDITGLTDAEDEELTQWERNNPTGYYDVIDEYPEFCRDDISGLLAECYRVTLWVDSAQI